MHEATWKLKTTGPFLLLNMVAIGSLFIGTEDAISKGEFLWEIAQVAASTRWNYSFELSLRHVAGDYPSWQIVSCALLGQLYAMMSRSVKLRHMAQTLHGWAFSWARTLGMFDLQPSQREDVPNPDSSPRTKQQAWKRWADVEMQKRTVLGLFIVDAQLGKFSRGVPLGKHVLNPLQCAASDGPFNAQSTEAWIAEMERTLSVTPVFRDVFLSVFDSRSGLLPISMSPYSALVVLEGLQAIISESLAAGGAAIGTKSPTDIADSLFRLQATLRNSTVDDGIEVVELLIRWHALCIDTIVDSVQLFRSICRQDQQIFCIGQNLQSEALDIGVWARSAQSRVALLHAVAIQELSQKLHLGRAHAIGVPAAVFAAATIFCAFIETNIQELRAPLQADHKMAHDIYTESLQGNPNRMQSQTESDLAAFLDDKPIQSRYKSINMRQFLYKCQVVLRTMAGQWGIAKDMLDLLSAWTTTT